jgi:alkylation response protein AidB-like acyl-CoA dehydrogenase
MDLNLSPQESNFRDEVRAWLEVNVPKGWRSENASRSVEEEFQFLRSWQRKMFDAGWSGVAWPKEYGGRGATLNEQVILWQEMARAGAPPIANFLALGIIGPTIIAFGTEAQKKRHLRNMLSAEEIWCQGFSEANAGSDLANLSSEAVLDGDHYIVNAHKIWNSLGWAADWCELVVRTDKNVPKHKGLSVLLVDMKSPGVTVRPLKQITGESEFCELFFRDVRVPVENLVGQVNRGWDVAVGTLMHERGTNYVSASVELEQNFKRMVKLAQSMQGANGQPLSEDPGIRRKLAQLYAEIEIMRLNQMRAFSRINATGVPGPEGSIQKLFFSEMAQRLYQLAMEILGPYGLLAKGAPRAIDDGFWLYGYLASRGQTIAAGTSEIQRNIIGHYVLGLPKSY